MPRLRRSKFGNDTKDTASLASQVASNTSSLADRAQVTQFDDINTIIKSKTTYSSGIYTINNPILLDGNTLGRKKLTLSFDSNIKFKVADALTNGAHAFQFQNFDYIELKGLKIDGNLQDNTTSFSKNGQNLTTALISTLGNNLIWINDCGRAVVEKCEFNNSSANGLFFKRVNDVTANHNIALNNFNGAITASQCLTKVFIQNNKATSTGDRGQTLNYTVGGIGILASESENVTIQDNKIYGWNDTATKTEGCNNVRYINNDVTDFGKDGIKVMGYPNSTLGDRTNVVNAEIKNNYVKNRYDGRPDGSSYILMHDVTNGIIDGNVVVKDNAITGTHDGIRVNNPIGFSSSNIKIINNQVTLNGTYNGLNVDGTAGHEINNVSIKNNRFSIQGYVGGVYTLEIEGNKFNECNYSATYLLYVNKCKDMKIQNNDFSIANVSVAGIMGMYVLIDKGMDFIDIMNNTFAGVSHRGIYVQSSAGLPSADKIKRLRIENNTINDFATQTVNFPSCCIGVIGNEVKIDVVKVKNNVGTKSSANSLDAFYWFHNSTNQKATITEYAHNYLNLDRAEMKNSHPQMGRLLDRPVMTAAPTYTTDFQAGDVVYKKTTANDKIMWKLISGAWTESY